ncbi:MAG: ADP-ribosylglycohydrolase family protein [Lentilitoribacter sp.]
MGKSHRIANCLKGALIADASALGVHWIYDVDRVAKIAKANGGSASFVPVDEANYENTKGYFAHPLRAPGANTQYGEVTHLAVDCLLGNHGKFDLEDYKKRFAGHFGPGGTYIGYIDHATRGTLENIAAENEETGTDDVQMPALVALPAIIALDPSNAANATRVTNDNPISNNAVKVFKGLLTSVLNGAELDEALSEAALIGEEELSELLQNAINTDVTDSIAYGGETGRACYLKSALPLGFHILKHTNSFEEAIEMNNQCAGDNAGRSIFIGAVAGAYYNGVTERGIPQKWVEKYHNSAEIFDKCDHLAAMS